MLSDLLLSMISLSPQTAPGDLPSVFSTWSAFDLDQEVRLGETQRQLIPRDKKGMFTAMKKTKLLKTGLQKVVGEVILRNWQ